LAIGNIMPVVMFSAHKLWCPSRIVVSTKRIVSMMFFSNRGNHMGWRRQIQ
jgi:hypothetical protein